MARLDWCVHTVPLTFPVHPVGTPNNGVYQPSIKRKIPFLDGLKFKSCRISLSAAAETARRIAVENGSLSIRDGSLKTSILFWSHCWQEKWPRNGAPPRTTNHVYARSPDSQPSPRNRGLPSVKPKVTNGLTSTRCETFASIDSRGVF